MPNELSKQSCELQRTYLAPIERVEFCNDVIDCETFQIRRFPSIELSAEAKKEVIKAFEKSSPDVQINEYWFICCTEAVLASTLENEGISSFLISPEIHRVYTKFPPVMEPIFQQLALYDWRSDWMEWYEDKDPEKNWFGFNIPFVIVLCNDQAELVPNPTTLEAGPDFDTEGNVTSIRPQRGLYFDSKMEQDFTLFVQNTNNVLVRLKSQKEWPFLDIALNHLVKAFFSEGLEQLLWHMTVLESLVGDKWNVTSSLKRRVSKILGKTKAEKEAISKKVAELYGFRSDLVHGNPLDKPVYLLHLREARDLARQILLWFLSYLDFVQIQLSGNQQMPDRKVLLQLVDMDMNTRQVIKGIINKLPSNFPHLSAWDTDKAANNEES